MTDVAPSPSSSIGKPGHHDAHDCTGSSPVWPDVDGAGHGGFCGRGSPARRRLRKSRSSASRTPEDAARALYEAMKGRDWKQIYAVLGPGSGKLIYTGDKVADSETRDMFVAAYEKSAKFDRDGDAKATLLLGGKRLSVPVPAGQGRARVEFRCACRRRGNRQSSRRRKRALRDPDLPCVRRRAARIRNQRSRPQWLARVRDETGQHAGQAGWPVLADEGGRTTQPLRAPDNAGRG